MLAELRVYKNTDVLKGFFESLHVLWQPRGSLQHGHHLFPVDLMQGAGGKSPRVAHRCDKQDAILPETGE